MRKLYIYDLRLFHFEIRNQVIYVQEERLTSENVILIVRIIINNNTT